MRTSFRGAPPPRPGSLQSRASRRSRSCGGGADTSDPAADQEERWADQHRGAILRKCLGALSSEHRTIIDLVYYHDKSVQEVAAIVGVPSATVKTRMFYARKKLAALLATQGVMRAAA
jgi:RNA polymerase sigma-70 factor, ECF subfamily